MLDWNSIMNKLEEIGYNGVFMYEIPLKAPKTIDRRTLTYSDFYENAKALFEHREPIKIGTPKKNLGLWGPIE
jgi:sugar phosphate isomerase/epimerase